MTAARKLMTGDEFLEWCLDQEGRWELVDGFPIQMMTGATQRHDMITVNLIVSLGSRLRGSGCRPTTDDIAARMFNGNIRRPDVTVDCGPTDAQSMESGEPTVFFEVLSPSTRRVNFGRKADEYRRVPTVRHFVLLEQNAAEAWLWSRDEHGAWTDQPILGLESKLALTALGIDLPLAEIYEGVPLED